MSEYQMRKLIALAVWFIVLLIAVAISCGIASG